MSDNFREATYRHRSGEQSTEAVDTDDFVKSLLNKLEQKEGVIWYEKTCFTFLRSLLYKYPLAGNPSIYTRTKGHPTLIPQEFIHRLRLKHIEIRVWQTV